MTQIYEQGLVKVVWIEENPDVIFSKMFDDQKSAVAFSENLKIKSFLIFKLNKQKNMTEFSWTLLPLGKYKTYRTLISVSQSNSMSVGNLLKGII